MRFAFRRNIITIIIIIIITLFVWKFFKVSSEQSLSHKLAKYSVEFSKSIDPNIHITSDSLKSALILTPANDSIIYNKLYLFSRNMFEQGLQTKAFEYLKTCIDIINHDPDASNVANAFKARCYLLLGSAADEVGLRALSQDYYFVGLKIADKYNTPYVGDFYNNIGVSYLRSNKFEQAVEYYNKALEHAEKYHNNYLKYIVYTNLAEISLRKGEYDNGIGHALKALQYVNEKTLPDDYYSTHAVIGQLYAGKKDFTTALVYLQNAYRNMNPHDPYYLFDTCLELNSVYTQMGQVDSAALYLTQAEKIAGSAGNLNQYVQVLSRKAENDLTRNNLLSTYNIQKKIITLKDSITSEENAIRIKQSNDIYNIEREADLRNTGIRSWNPVIVFSSMGALILLLIMIIIWIVKIWRKKERAVIERARAVTELNELQAKQLHAEKEKQLKIKSELEINERKLTSFTLDRIKTAQDIEEVATIIKKVILELPVREKSLRESLKGVIVKLSSLKNESQWEEFQYYFERVHPEFYKCLDEKHPGLTIKDRRLCALLSLGLSTKDIASLTFREVRSVESSRNRLRKKLGIDIEINLVDYMLSLYRLSPSHKNADPSNHQP